MPMIFDELKDISTIPELQIKYRSISDAEMMLMSSIENICVHKNLKRKKIGYLKIYLVKHGRIIG